MNFTRSIAALLPVLAVAGVSACSSTSDQAGEGSSTAVQQALETTPRESASNLASRAEAPRTGETDVGIVVDDSDGKVNLDLDEAIFVSTQGDAPGVRTRVACDGSSYGIITDGWGLGHGITKYALAGPTAQQDLPLDMARASLPSDVTVTEELDTIMTSDYSLGLSLLVQPGAEDVTCDVYVTDLSNGNVLVNETVVDGPYDGIAYVMYQPGMQ